MYTIREYSSADNPVLEVLMENFQRYFISIDPERRPIDGLGYGKIKVTEMLDKVTEKQGKIFVACKGPEVVGFGACIIEVPSEAEKLENPMMKYGTLTELFIDEKYRGAKIGKQLMGTAEAFLRDKGCARMYLEVVGQNDKAKKFYELNGYTVREYVMAKDLT